MAAGRVSLYPGAGATGAQGPTGATGPAGVVAGVFKPSDHGLSAWSYELSTATAGTVLTNGTVYLVRMPALAAGATIAKIYWHVSVVAVSPTAGQNEVGLYADTGGAPLAVTNVDSVITSTGLKTTTITGQALALAQASYVGFVFNAGTAPSITRASGVAAAGGFLNLGLAAASYRYATNVTSQAVLPSVVMASNAQAPIALWAAIGT